MTEQWTHSDQEEWFPGHETYPTRKEAITAGREDYEGSFWVGRVQTLQATDLVSVEDYVDSVHERLYGRTGCCNWNCDRPDVLSKETLETLTAAINDAVPISTYEVVDIERVLSAADLQIIQELKERLAKKKMPKAGQGLIRVDVPYDEVFEEGTAWLDSLAMSDEPELQEPRMSEEPEPRKRRELSEEKKARLREAKKRIAQKMRKRIAQKMRKRIAQKMRKKEEE